MPGSPRPASDGNAPVTAPRLRRVLGLWEVTAGGVGIIIGAGIYVLISAATAEAGGAVWLAFLLAAGLALLTGLSYAELTSMFPSAAAEYEYTRHAFPIWLSLLVGWAMIAGLMVAASTIALGFAGYLDYFLDVPLRFGAIALIVLAATIATRGIKQSARLTLVLGTVQVGGLIAVAAVGLPHLGNEDLLEVTSPAGLLGAAALVFFAFIGFDEVITLAEETQDPTRTVPRALLLALGISTALYVAVAVAAVSILGAADLAASERPLADVMRHAIGGQAEGVMAIVAMITTMNTTLLCVTAASRLLYGMADRGALPSPLAAVSSKTGAPIRAILVAAAVAGAFTLLGDLTLLASVTDFAVYLVFLAVNATVVILRVRQPELPRGFRVPFSVRGIPVVPLLGFASVIVMLTQLDRLALGLGLLFCGVGLIASVVYSRHIDLETTN